MDKRVESIRVMYPLFQEEEGGSTPTSTLTAKDLRIERIPFERAKELNREWHSRLPLFKSAVGKMAYLCFGAMNGDACYAVAIWSNPVARLLPQRTWLELRRLATAPDAPKNTCSRMIRIMEMIIRKEKPDIEVLVSYQDTEVHTGGIYAASGWTMNPMEGSQTHWGCPSRPRDKSQSEAKKHRWEKRLKPMG